MKLRLKRTDKVCIELEFPTFSPNEIGARQATKGCVSSRSQVMTEVWNKVGFEVGFRGPVRSCQVAVRYELRLGLKNS